MAVRQASTRRGTRRKSTWSWAPAIYVFLLMLPIYWMVNMSFKPGREILTRATLLPDTFTLSNYMVIFTDPSWYMAYLHASIYVVMNVAISITVALPAAYAFSRYRFIGDKHMFFWFLASRMMPPAVMLVPYVQVFSELQLIDTHIAVALAHCLFTVPIAVWILEGFISSVPRQMDEAARVDGYSLPRFFFKILIPQIAPGIGVTAFFCFMFSWIELLFANALTTITAKPIGPVMGRAGGLVGGINFGLLSAASVLTLIPGILMIYFVRKHIARGLSMGQVK